MYGFLRDFEIKIRNSINKLLDLLYNWRERIKNGKSIKDKDKQDI